jgi:3-oxoacyl-[acyl-carrier protein] reductase
VVTGGARGIGFAVAEALAQAGAKIALVDIDEDDTRDAAGSLPGDGHVGFRGDVTDAGGTAAVLKEIEAELGPVDVLVNNAGITRDGLVVLMKEQDWDDVIQTNLKGAFNCIKAVTRPMMKQRYGRIINITSVVGVMGNPGQANYAASKAGIIGLTKSVAKELASRNITVNAVAPGFVETDMTADLPEKAKEAMLAMIPLGRAGTPEEVAGLTEFLASDTAAYITGQVVHVSGGMYT